MEPEAQIQFQCSQKSWTTTIEQIERDNVISEVTQTVGYAYIVQLFALCTAMSIF